jgi:hypothetical protein
VSCALRDRVVADGLERSGALGQARLHALERGGARADRGADDSRDELREEKDADDGEADAQPVALGPCRLRCADRAHQ